MAQVSETCSCGAQFTWISKDADAAQTAVEGWRTGHRHVVKPEDDGHRPAGGNTASVERKADSTAHELDAEFRPGPYGRGISLKWHRPEVILPAGKSGPTVVPSKGAAS